MKDIKKTDIRVRNEIQKRIHNIKNNIDSINNSMHIILHDLIYLKEHQSAFLAETGMTFEKFINHELNMSKQLFYEKIKAYEFCADKGHTELYNQAKDKNALLAIARITDDAVQKKVLKEYIKKPEMSRHEVHRVRQSYSEQLDKKNKIPAQRLANENFKPVEPKKIIKLITIYERWQKSATTKKNKLRDDVQFEIGRSTGEADIIRLVIKDLRQLLDMDK